MIGDQTMQGILRDGSKFTTIVPMGKMPDLADLMMEHNVELRAAPTATPCGWRSQCHHIGGFVGIWLFILNQMQGGNNRACLRQEPS